MPFFIQLWKHCFHCYVESIHMLWCRQNQSIWKRLLELFKSVNHLFFLHNLLPVFEKFVEVICMGCIPLYEPLVITHLPEKCSQLSLCFGKKKISPFQYWRDLCESHLVKQCGQTKFLLCIQNDIFQDSKKHLPSPIDKTLISNYKDVFPSSHTLKNHPRTLEQKVQCMVPTPCSWTFEKF